MTDTRMLLGSLSNDLYRVATSLNRKSYAVSDKFWLEAHRWTEELLRAKTPPYIARILRESDGEDTVVCTDDQAEKLFMYSILLKNYALHV